MDRGLKAAFVGLILHLMVCLLLLRLISAALEHLLGDLWQVLVGGEVLRQEVTARWVLLLLLLPLRRRQRCPSDGGAPRAGGVGDMP